MNKRKDFDVIIVGGSYSGLAAGMALGRSLRQVLIIDSGLPCNRQSPHSHNFLTQDGKTPAEISGLGRRQVELYDTVKFFDDMATSGARTENGFEIRTASGETFRSKKLVFATGVKNIMSDMEGYSECWGRSLLHCPYCHGYEVRNERTGILGNGEYGFEFSLLISNWTKDLTLFTNGSSTLTDDQTAKIRTLQITIVEKEIERLDHDGGYLRKVILRDGTNIPVKALYTRSPFEQHCKIPQTLGCKLTDEGYIAIDSLQKTNIPGVYACGDNTSRMRTVANAVAMGTAAGAMLNRDLVFDEF